jgi:hypothetical protein
MSSLFYSEWRATSVLPATAPLSSPPSLFSFQTAPDCQIRAAWFETALSRLLTMRNWTHAIRDDLILRSGR